MTYRPQDPRPGERGYGPVTPVEPNTETHRRTERPRDLQGLPMLTSGDVAQDLGITHPENYKEAAYGEVPHYVDTKSGNLLPTSNTRVWFALQDIVNHFAIKAGAHKPVEQRSNNELAFGSRHLKWHNRHQQALKTEEVNRENGIHNGDFWNQPDPRNRGIYHRIVQGTRQQTEDDPATGDLVGRPLAPDSNLANAVANGSMKPVVKPANVISKDDDDIDFSDPNRPRRR